MITIGKSRLPDSIVITPRSSFELNSTAESEIAKSSTGNAQTTSRRRVKRVSIKPPKKPVTSPTMSATTEARAAAATLIKSVLRPA